MGRIEEKIEKYLVNEERMSLLDKVLKTGSNFDYWLSKTNKRYENIFLGKVESYWQSTAMKSLSDVQDAIHSTLDDLDIKYDYDMVDDIIKRSAK